MAPCERLFAARAKIVDKTFRIFGREALVPAVVDHHQRCPVARAQAFNFHQREQTVSVVPPGSMPSASINSSVTRSAPRSAQGSVRHTCTTYFPTGRV